MNKLKILLVPLLLVLTSAKAAPTGSEFYSDSGILTIPSVKVGDIYVYDAQLRLNNTGSFDLVGYSLSPSNGVFVDDECRDKHITLEKYQQIKSGMTLDQVNSIVGCKGQLFTATPLFTIYNWSEGGYPEIQVVINSDGVFNPRYTPGRN